MSDGAYLRERINSRCIEDGDCFIWQGAMDSDGCPTIRRPGSRKVESVRRVILEIEGRLKKGHLAASTCGNRACVMSAHIACVSRRQLGVMAAKATGYAKNPVRNSKISAAARQRGKLSEEARHIILQGGKSQRAFAEQFNVSQYAVGAFLRGKSYKTYGGHFSGLGGRS